MSSLTPPASASVSASPQSKPVTAPPSPELLQTADKVDAVQVQNMSYLTPPASSSVSASPQSRPVTAPPSPELLQAAKHSKEIVEDPKRIEMLRQLEAVCKAYPSRFNGGGQRWDGDFSWGRN